MNGRPLGSSGNGDGAGVEVLLVAGLPSTADHTLAGLLLPGAPLAFPRPSFPSHRMMPSSSPQSYSLSSRCVGWVAASHLAPPLTIFLFVALMSILPPITVSLVLTVMRDVTRYLYRPCG